MVIIIAVIATVAIIVKVRGVVGVTLSLTGIGRLRCHRLTLLISTNTTSEEISL